MATTVLLMALGALAPLAAAAQTGGGRGMIGVMLAPVDTLGGRTGPAVVADVRPGSPAARAGLQRGDTVVAWNGLRGVLKAVADRPLQTGDTVRLRVRRDGRERAVSVVAGRAPRDLVRVFPDGDGGEVIVLRPGEVEREVRVQLDSLVVRLDSLHRHLRVVLADSLAPQLRAMRRELAREMPELRIRAARLPDDALLLELGSRGVAGAEFTELNEGLAGYFDTPRGVLVLRVAPETPAARAGLRAGDVVVAAGGEPVASVAELRRAVLRAGRDAPRTLPLEIVRKGERRSLSLRWE